MVALNRQKRSCRKTIKAARERMIRQTSIFLTLALRRSGSLPRIPRKRVDQGGFSELLEHQGAKSLVRAFWAKTLGE